MAEEKEITFDIIVSVLSRYLYGDMMSWICPFCRLSLVEITGDKAIQEAIESNGYCSNCREGCNRADSREKSELEEAARAQINDATGWTNYESGRSPFFDEEQ